MAEEETPAPQQAQQPQTGAAPSFAPPAQASAPPALGACPPRPHRPRLPPRRASAPPPAATPPPASACARAGRARRADHRRAQANTPPGGCPGAALRPGVPQCMASRASPVGSRHGQVPGQTAPLPSGYGQPPRHPRPRRPPPGHGQPTRPPATGSPARLAGHGQPTPRPAHGQPTAPARLRPAALPQGGTAGHAPGAPQGAGATAALQQFRETATGQRWTQQNQKLVRVDLGEEGQPRARPAGQHGDLPGQGRLRLQGRRIRRPGRAATRPVRRCS